MLVKSYALVHCLIDKFECVRIPDTFQFLSILCFYCFLEKFPFNMSKKTRKFSRLYSCHADLMLKQFNLK